MDLIGRDNGKEHLYINAVKGYRHPKAKNALGNDCSFNNCCGLAATGSEDPSLAGLSTAIQADASNAANNSTIPVQNIQAWNYFKTGLALVGAYVVIKFLYVKFAK